jgi:hypothetical protein
VHESVQQPQVGAAPLASSKRLTPQGLQEIADDVSDQYLRWALTFQQSRMTMPIPFHMHDGGATQSTRTNTDH